MADVFVAAAASIAVVMLVTWSVSIVVRDVSIVDIVWGIGFVVVAWTSWAVGDGPDARRTLLAALVSIWGLRLAIYLALRNLGSGEDRRYQSMRRHWAPHFWIVSLATVFVLQGALQWIVSLPVQVGAGSTVGGTGVLAGLGTAVWAVGIVFESVGDLQLARFKSRPSNAGAVMDRGLWRYTRHPNYFGDACVWWGVGLVGLEAGWRGAIALIGPAIMTIFLVRVSGAALLERTIGTRRPGYEDYVRRTSGFIPRPPRS